MYTITSVTPKGTLILVKPLRYVISSSKGGIQLARPQEVELPLGRVVFVGPRADKDIKVGDIIAFMKFHGHMISINSEDYYVLNTDPQENDVIASVTIEKEQEDGSNTNDTESGTDLGDNYGGEVPCRSDEGDSNADDADADLPGEGGSLITEV